MLAFAIIPNPLSAFRSSAGEREWDMKEGSADADPACVLFSETGVEPSKSISATLAIGRRGSLARKTVYKDEG
jgi:hypothetical protein